MPENPYVITAGPELDLLIHREVMGFPDGQPEPYSTDDHAADKVRVNLKNSLGRQFVYGRSNMRGRKWFARNETDTSGGTEVLAETYPLAICRLALLTIRKFPA